MVFSASYSGFEVAKALCDASSGPAGIAQKQMLVEGKGERGSGQPPSPGSSQQDAADKRCKDESAATKKLMRRSVQRGLAVRGRKTSSKDVAAKHFPGSRSLQPLAHHGATASNEEHSSATRTKGIVGPRRAPTNIRTSIRIDHEPNICKDYQRTGYCGYGDNCIYLHDRGSYKSGWQLEKSGIPFRHRESVSSGEGCV